MTSKIELIRNYYSDLDNSRDTVASLATALFDEQVVARMGNNPSVVGRENLIEMLSRTRSSLERSIHTWPLIHKINENLFIGEGHVKYFLKNGIITEEIPACVVYEFKPNTDLVIRYQAYVNQTPVLVASGFDVSGDESGKLIIKQRP